MKRDKFITHHYLLDCDVVIVEEFVFKIFLVPGELVALFGHVFGMAALKGDIGKAAFVRVNSDSGCAAKAVFVVFTVLEGAIDLRHGVLQKS